jgi:tetratricopeptide (TPR) repeat protein
VARRAAGKLRSNESGSASKVWRETVDGGPARSSDGDWVRVDDVRTEARGAVARGSRVLRDDEAPTRRPKRPAPAVAAELERSVGSTQAPKLGQRLAEATKAFERERFVEARKLLKPLAERAPGTAAVRELHGLTLYRLGHWKLAVKELEAFRTLTGSTEQHPVLADCYRALHQYGHVEELWAELRAASPGADLVAEGRIVAAGALADQGRTRDAIALLEAAARWPKRLQDHHLRLMYALADLYERAGDVPKARQLFRHLADAAPGFADVDHRLRAL